MINRILIIVISFIMGMLIDRFFLRTIYVNWKSYRKAWEPIYENRKEHFDIYLKYALDNSKSTEPIKNVATYAARLRIDANKSNHKSYDYWVDYYLHELRSANIE